MSAKVMNQVQPPSLVHAFARQDEQFARAFTLIHWGIQGRATPGGVLAVTFREKLIAWKAFGKFTYEDDSPAVRPETVYDLASVTKAVGTTTLAMLLYERGELRLSRKVRHHFSEFEEGDKAAVTVGMLLSHSSGLPAYEKLFQRCHTREELVRAAAAAPLAYSPGKRSEYSDLGFILLGEILTEFFEWSLDQCCSHLIFYPLGMGTAEMRPLARPSTHITAADLIPPAEEDRDFRRRVIQGEVDDENASVMGGAAGHAGMFASAYDLALFAECLLRGGSPILQPETVCQFTTRQSQPEGTSFALGWDTPSQPSQSGRLLSARAFGHLGYTGTSLWIDPEKRLSITFLTNRTWPHRESQDIKQLRPAVHDAIVEALEH